MRHDTIFAVSTGRARAAIAIIRVSGPVARFALETLCGPAPRPRVASLRKVRNAGADRRVLDEALVLFFPGPKSETGEDLVELQVHGGRAVVAAVLGALASIAGCRPAEPGEFARRALRNGKMTLLDLEAMADLIDADTEAQRRQAIEGGGSLLHGKADRWREALLDIQADLEAQIDFSDEGDVQQYFDSQTQRLIRALMDDISGALRSADRGEKLRDGFRVALIGAPNAGKSSLINAIAGRTVAIVSDVPGTTRDRIEVALDLGGLPVLVVDTAGMQSTQDRIEMEGIRLSHLSATEADLVLWLSPADAPASAPEEFLSPRLRVIHTKADLVGAAGPGQHRAGEWASVSALDGASIERLIGLIADEAEVSLDHGEPAIVTRARHRHALELAVASLGRALLVAGDDLELRAEEIRLTCRALERLLGRIDVEDVLGAIFQRFCIGK